MVVGMALAADAALVVVAVSVVAVVGLLVVVDLVGVAVVVGEGGGAGGAPASAFTAPIAGGARVAAVGSAHTIDPLPISRHTGSGRVATSPTWVRQSTGGPCSQGLPAPPLSTYLP
jgi:hypothetical protein